MASSSRKNVTSVATMATALQTAGKIATKITTEKTIRLQKIPASQGMQKLWKKRPQGC